MGSRTASGWGLVTTARSLELSAPPPHPLGRGERLDIGLMIDHAFVTKPPRAPLLCGVQRASELMGAHMF